MSTRIPLIEAGRLLSTGIDPACRGRSASYFLSNHDEAESTSFTPGLSLMDIAVAMQTQSRMRERLWQLVSPQKDEYTRRVQEAPLHGYFIHVQRGVKVAMPAQACLFMSQEGFHQSVHNLIVIEDDAELQIITGCASASQLQGGSHVGVSEIYIGRGAKLTYTMVHHWAEQAEVRPRTGVRIEEGGVFVSNYVCMHPVGVLQMSPVVHCAGRGARTDMNSVLIAHGGSVLDVGVEVRLEAEDTAASVVSRAVGRGGDIIARGRMVGLAREARAHLECMGLLLSGQGSIRAIPELEGRSPELSLSHEAAVGKIAPEEVEYLTARGLSAKEAASLIVRGFLNVSVMGLPELLTQELNKTAELAAAAEG